MRRTIRPTLCHRYRCNAFPGFALIAARKCASLLLCTQLLLNFLREELCVKRGLDVIFRTWDTSTQLFHAK